MIKIDKLDHILYTTKDWVTVHASTISRYNNKNSKLWKCVK